MSSARRTAPWSTAAAGLCFLALLTACISRGSTMTDLPPGTPINPTCPRSGKPVVDTSLTEYRGYTVGFCNPHCRDDFAADPEACAEDRRHFDALIAELEG